MASRNSQLELVTARGADPPTGSDGEDRFEPAEAPWPSRRLRTFLGLQVNVEIRVERQVVVGAQGGGHLFEAVMLGTVLHRRRQASGDLGPHPAGTRSSALGAYDQLMLKKVLILAVLVALGAIAAKRLRGS
jgi:hypothetical protein